MEIMDYGIFTVLGALVFKDVILKGLSRNNNSNEKITDKDIYKNCMNNTQILKNIEKNTGDIVNLLREQ